MLASIKHYTVKGLSTVGAAAAFIIMLPLTLAAMLLMTIAGMFALANLRHRVRAARKQGQWQTVDNNTTATHNRKPPIEGSYTVVSE